MAKFFFKVKYREDINFIKLRVDGGSLSVASCWNTDVDVSAFRRNIAVSIPDDTYLMRVHIESKKIVQILPSALSGKHKQLS